MPPRAPTTCQTDGCPNIATHRGRCHKHRTAPWRNRSPSSQAARTPAHRQARKTAAARAGGQCEHCGAAGQLALHHPQPIAHGGAVVQPDAPMLCQHCHRQADRSAGVRH